MISRCGAELVRRGLGDRSEDRPGARGEAGRRCHRRMGGRDGFQWSPAFLRGSVSAPLTDPVSVPSVRFPQLLLRFCPSASLLPAVRPLRTSPVAAPGRVSGVSFRPSIAPVFPGSVYPSIGSFPRLRFSVPFHCFPSCQDPLFQRVATH
jgi:hypothetical protein